MAKAVDWKIERLIEMGKEINEREKDYNKKVGYFCLMELLKEYNIWIDCAKANKDYDNVEKIKQHKRDVMNLWRVGNIRGLIDIYCI